MQIARCSRLLLLAMVSAILLLGTTHAQDAMSEEGFLQIGESEIFYQVAGQGQPMVLVHGYPLSGDLFGRARDTLDDAFRVITLDLRGYGRSTAADVPASIETYANDVLALMDVLEVSEAIVGGMSMGGPIAFEMYRQAPERFTGMILIDTIAAAASPAEAGLWRGAAEHSALLGLGSLANFLMPDMLSGDTRLEQPELAEGLTNMMLEASISAAVGGAYALANRPDYTDLLGRIDVPVLILVGAADSVYPVAIAQRMHEALDNSTLTILSDPDPAHAAIFEAPEASAQAILSWAQDMGMPGAPDQATMSGTEATDEEPAVTQEEFATLQTATYQIYPTEGSSPNGVVQVTESPNGNARVVVTMLGLVEGVAYPSHFHQGDCGSGGPIVYPLQPVPGGPETNVSEVQAGVFDIINSDLYINVHAPDDLSNILACGEVGQGANDQWR